MPITPQGFPGMLYQEERQFMRAMHPQIIGRPFRFVALAGLIQHIAAHANVWFARCDDVAKAVRPMLQAKIPGATARL